MSKFCGICVRDIPVNSPTFELDGVCICSSCAEDEVEATDSDRGYNTPGGLGLRFMQQVSVAHAAIVPPHAVRLDYEVCFEAPPSDPRPSRNRKGLVQGCKVRR